MWLPLGVFTIVITLLNIHTYRAGKEYKNYMALGLGGTALVLCDFYYMTAKWAKASDWAAIGRVVPTMDTVLWVLTGLSVLLNVLPIILEHFKKKKQ